MDSFFIIVFGNAPGFKTITRLPHDDVVILRTVIDCSCINTWIFIVVIIIIITAAVGRVQESLFHRWRCLARAL